MNLLEEYVNKKYNKVKTTSEFLCFDIPAFNININKDVYEQSIKDTLCSKPKKQKRLVKNLSWYYKGFNRFRNIETTCIFNKKPTMEVLGASINIEKPPLVPNIEAVDIVNIKNNIINEIDTNDEEVEDIVFI